MSVSTSRSSETDYGMNTKAILVYSGKPSKSSDFEIRLRQQDGTMSTLYRVKANHGQLRFSRVANFDMGTNGKPRCQSLDSGTGSSTNIGTVNFHKLSSKTTVEIPGYAKVNMPDGKESGGYGLGKVQFSKAAKSGRRGSAGDNVGDIMAMIVANRGLYWRKRQSSSNRLEEYQKRDEVTIAQFKTVEVHNGLSYGQDHIEVSILENDLAILDVIAMTGTVVMMQKPKPAKEH